MKKDIELRKWVAKVVKEAIEKGYFHTDDDKEARKILDKILDKEIGDN